MSISYPPLLTRRLITLFIMTAAIMNQVDTTIANVALPHMQGTTSASREQITWVLTSYLIALAITTPLTGWLAGRFGRKRLLLTSIVLFTLCSGLCGIAVNLGQLILFRILQGMAGSALVPMSQATLLDINPPERHGNAMAVFGLAGIMGPLIGPVLGGWLTENLSWHWVFLINLPIGLFAFLGISAFMPESHEESPRRFDMLGFGLLAIGVGSLQLMLDRGQLLDWFDSAEISIEATLAATALFMFVVHVLTAEYPFVRLAIFRDRNFVISTLMGFFVGMLIFGTMSLLPPLLSELLGHPIIIVGLVMAPRGLGNLCATLVIGRIIGRIDTRMICFIGMMASGLSSLALAQMSLQANDIPVIVSGILNGIGTTMIFVPLATMTFATLPREYRNEGAAMTTLIRYIGSAGGISVLQTLTLRNTAAVQSRLTEGLRPDDPVIGWQMPSLDFTMPDALARLDGEVLRQALMVAYVDDFWLLFLVSICIAPFVFLLSMPKLDAKLPCEMASPVE